jgi:hypothetical protein
MEKEVRILATRSSDYKPLLLRFSKTRQVRNSRNRGFRLEANWMCDDEFGRVVKEQWEINTSETNRLTAVWNKLGRCGEVLKKWGRGKFGNIEESIKSKTATLEALQREEGPRNVDRIKTLQQEIDLLLEQEDVKWRQRAKLSWYEKGDRNTPYFHAWVSQRRRTNRINRMEDDDGVVWKDEQEISQAFVNFFNQLYTSEGSACLAECMEGVQAAVTEDMNKDLLAKFTSSEVEAALTQMAPLKSPGLNSFAAIFYQKSWSTINKEVCEAVLGFLNGGFLTMN